MRHAIRDTLKVFFILLGGAALFQLILYGFPAALGIGFGFGFVGLFGLLLNGWALFTFLRDRQGRQEELLQVLLAAVEAGMPLLPAIDAYRRERRRPGIVRRGLRLLSFLLLPLYGYIRIWTGLQSYDHLLWRFRQHVRAGDSLATALAAVPGLATRETRLAAEVGEATGALALCLRTAGRPRFTITWVELAPALIYPLVVLWIVVGVTTFLMVAILPKFKRIFDEFEMALPAPTQALVDGATWIADDLALVNLLLWLGILGIAAVVALPTVRWHTPLLKRLYHAGVQADVLRALGRLLATGRTVPQSLAALADSSALPMPARRRLSAASVATTAGDALPETLRRVGLLPVAMEPLLRAAGRANTLPWALEELGDHLASRVYRRVRRVMLVVSPLTIVAVGLLVGFIAIGMFVPLLELMSGLGGMMRLVARWRGQWRAGRCRSGWLATDTLVALGVLAVLSAIVAKLSHETILESRRALSRQDALEAAANVLEQARARPWEQLTPDWAKAQALPDFLKTRWPEGTLSASVDEEPKLPRVKRVRVTVSWDGTRPDSERSLTLMGLFAPRSAEAAK